MDLNRFAANWSRDELLAPQDSKSQVESAHHVDDLWVDLLRDDSSVLRNVFEHLVQCLSLDLLALQFRAGIVEVEHHFALLQFPYEELVALLWPYICTICQPSTKDCRMTMSGTHP